MLLHTLPRNNQNLPAMRWFATRVLSALCHAAFLVLAMYACHPAPPNTEADPAFVDKPTDVIDIEPDPPNAVTPNVPKDERSNPTPVLSSANTDMHKGGVTNNEKAARQDRTSSTKADVETPVVSSTAGTGWVVPPKPLNGGAESRTHLDDNNDGRGHDGLSRPHGSKTPVGSASAGNGEDRERYKQNGAFWEMRRRLTKDSGTCTAVVGETTYRVDIATGRITGLSGGGGSYPPGTIYHSCR